LLAVFAPETALAKRVAVLGFKGPAAKAEKAVVEALRNEGHQIVGPATWNKASTKARAKGTSPAALAKTAKKAGVAAIVFGKVQKKGKKTFLVLTVHDGMSGSPIETVEIPLKAGKVDKKAQEALAQELMPVVRRAQGPSEGDEGTVRGTSERAQAGDTERPGEREGGRPGPTGSEGTPQERVSDTEKSPSGEEEGRVKKRQADEEAPGEKRSFFAASAGMSFWARTLSVSPDQAADTYKGQPVPGLRVDGEVYPAAIFAKNIAADFGIGFLVDMLWLKSELSGGGGKLPTTQTRWGADLRWRWKFLSKDTSPVLRVAFQVSQMSFKIDRTNAPPDLNIPDVSYLTFAPVLGANFPLGSKMFALGGSFAFLIAKESGTPTDTTVSGMPWGIEAGLNFDVLPLQWLLIRAQFGIIRYAVKLTPTGTAEATGMSDMYLGGFVTAGYVWN